MTTPKSAAPSALAKTLSTDWAGPAFEVDHFGWAAQIAELVASGGADLDAMAHKILSATRGGGQVVAIASAEPGAGGTTLLICLAQRLAAMQLKAALVDADFADPTLAERLGMSPVVRLGRHRRARTVAVRRAHRVARRRAGAVAFAHRGGAAGAAGGRSLLANDN